MLIDSLSRQPAAMDGFDPMTMAYLNVAAPPMHHGLQGLSTPEMLMPMDTLSNYDNETYVGSEDASQYGMPVQPSMTPSFKRLSHTYEDAFSDHMSQYDQHLTAEPSNFDSPSIDRDHKLLSFGLPTITSNVLDFAARPVPMSVSAQLHGMFFLAESAWPTGPGEVTPQPELTCYRRNLFQVTGSVTLPKGLRYVLREQGEQLPILSQELVISATESVEQNAVKIISVPWKTPAASAPQPTEDKSDKEPATVSLDLSNGQDIDADLTNFPFAWKRLQFRIATANNGRRKELQQHFLVHLRVMATLADGSKVSLCETQSGPIIVRGRSPRNFQSRKDTPIGGSASSAARRAMSMSHTNGSNTSLPPQISRASTGDSGIPVKLEAPPFSAPLDMTQMALPSPYDASTEMSQMSPTFFEWQMPAGSFGAIPSTFPLVPSDGPPNPNAMYAQSVPDLSRTAMHNMQSASGRATHARHRSQQNITIQPPRSQPQSVTGSAHTAPVRAPINLSLTDDTTDSLTPRTRKSPSGSPSDDNAQLPPKKAARLSTGPGSSTFLSPGIAHASLRSPDFIHKNSKSPSQQHNFAVPLASPHNNDADSADLLYEYFPLGLDDWMPPVDAVYRPHVVHHTNLPADPQGGAFSSGFAPGAGMGLAGIGAGAVLGTAAGNRVEEKRKSKRIFVDGAA